MANEHVTSFGYTFSQHMSLATAWTQYNGQKGTEKQALRVMRVLSAPVLVRLLTERMVALPLGCNRPVVTEEEARAILNDYQMPNIYLCENCGLASCECRTGNEGDLGNVNN